MAQYIGATGQALPPPQALYPQYIQNLPNVSATNVVSLPPGGDAIIPSGKWFLSTGPYTVVQTLDPVSLVWRQIATYTANKGNFVESDGTNFRVYNPTGFPIGALISNAGTGYTSTPTVTASAGGSTWVAIVGGGISAINLTSGANSGFSVPPLVNIAAPPTQGVQASAVCTISGGAVNGFTIVNPGAGYGTVPPAVTLVPQANDLNLASTSTTRLNVPPVTTQLSYVGQVTAVLLVNEGNTVQATPPVLTFAGGGGTGATATAVMAYTITNLTVTTAGSGYTTPAFITTVGGTITSAAAATNNAYISTGMLIPRAANILLAIQSGTGVAPTTIIDGGLFQQAPSMVVMPGPQGVGPVNSVLTPTMGGVNDTVFVTPI